MNIKIKLIVKVGIVQNFCRISNHVKSYKYTVIEIHELY